MLKYSIVTPIFNDSYLAEAFCYKIEDIFQFLLKESDVSKFIELIFIDDGSNSKNQKLLKEIASRFKFTKIVLLSRNFGQHIALSCGYKEAQGSFIIMINVDMQDSPDYIPGLIDKIESAEIDIVYTLRSHRKDPLLKKYSSILFNFVLNKLTRSSTPLNISTLRIMSRKFINSYNSLNESSRYIPGLESWLGFDSAYVEIEHEPRNKGSSSYNFKRRLSLAINSIISFSDFPLKIASLLGIGLAILGSILIMVLVFSKLFFIDYRPGYTSTISIIVFIGGVQIFVIGVAGLYIGRILSEVQRRPLYVIKEKINFDTDQ